VKLQEMGRKINTKLNNYKTFDRSDNMIGPEDAVRVVDGTYRGREGTVKHVFRQFVFIHARDMIDNSGMFVVKGKQCEVSGGRLRSTNQMQRMPRPFSFAKRGRKHHLTDKVVIITRGMYKGYLGNVKDANDMTARVELHSHFKTITVETKHLKEVRPESRQNNVTPRSQVSTPWSRFRDGSETPYYDGARTPYHDGGRTPMHDRGPETPNRNDVWNPNVVTPRPWQEESQVPTTPQTTARTPFSPAVSSFPHSVQTPIVQTPATFTTPSIQTPHTPGPVYTTPGITTPMVNVPQTPGVSMMQTPHTPGPITPVEIPKTPGVPITPAPLTPGVRDTEEEVWVSPGIEVEVNEEPYTGLIGVIRSVNYTLCTILLKQNDEEKVVDVEQAKLKLTKPKKGDRVKVIKGKDKGLEGKLVGIDESSDGEMVILKAGDKINLYSLDHVAKIVE
jgi:transcription elongation factor SPT5